MSKTCFFISPIGKENSEERIQSDFLLENVLSYSCEPFGLKPLRADQLRGTSDINNDVIQLLHTAEVCVVDLTGLNANVMFELGMRIETGLPLVIIAKQGTVLPFDIHSLRTIFFGDIKAAAECNRLEKEIRAYFGVCAMNDYKTTESEPTISDVYNLLEQVLNSVNAVSAVNNSDLNSLYDTSVETEQLLSYLDPSEAFQFAYKTNKITIAEELLDYLKDQPQRYYLNKVCTLAIMGSIKAMNEIEKILPQALEEYDFDEAFELLGSLISCYMRRDIEKQKRRYIEPIFEKAMKAATKNVQKAAVYNQMQRFAAGIENYEKAIEYAKQAISLYDEEPAYYYNYATILCKKDNTEEAKVQIKKCIETASNDEPHEDGLMLACRLFKGSENEEEHKYFVECYTKLKEINPIKARLINLE